MTITNTIIALSYNFHHAGRNGLWLDCRNNENYQWKNINWNICGEIGMTYLFSHHINNARRLVQQEERFVLQSQVCIWKKMEKSCLYSRFSFLLIVAYNASITSTGLYRTQEMNIIPFFSCRNWKFCGVGWVARSEFKLDFISFRTSFDD